MKRGTKIIGTALLLGALTGLGGCVYPYQRPGVVYSDDGQYYGGNAAVDAYDNGGYYYYPGYYYDPWWGYGPYIGLGFYGGGYWGGRGPWRHGYGGGWGGHGGHSVVHSGSHMASGGHGGGSHR